VVNYTAALVLGLFVVIVAGCGANEPEHQQSTSPAAAAPVEEGMAFPRRTAGPSAPRFLSGDTAETEASPKDWVMVALKERIDEDRYVVYGYVHKGQDATDWTELVTYMNTPKPDEPPLAFMARQKVLMQRKCPQVRFTMVKQSESEVTYESEVAKCAQVGDEDEIVRVIYGQINLFRISYTARVAQMPAPQRAEAIKLLSEFQLRDSH
jgi:hypothetical protein